RGAGFLRRWIENPSLDVVRAFVIDRPTGNLRSTGDPGQVRSDRPGRALDSWDRVAAGALFGPDQLRAVERRGAGLDGWPGSGRRGLAKLIGWAAGLAVRNRGIERDQRNTQHQGQDQSTDSRPQPRRAPERITVRVVM